MNERQRLGLRTTVIKCRMINGEAERVMNTLKNDSILSLKSTKTNLQFINNIWKPCLIKSHSSKPCPIKCLSNHRYSSYQALLQQYKTTEWLISTFPLGKALLYWKTVITIQDAKGHFLCFLVNFHSPHNNVLHKAEKSLHWKRTCHSHLTT